MPPKLRQRESRREVSVHMENSQAESAINLQGQDPSQPPPSDPNQGAIKQLKEKDVGVKTFPQNEGENQEKPHQDSGSHNKETIFVTMSDVADLLKQEREKNPKERRHFVRKPLYPIELLNQPYPEKYVVPTFSRFDGRKGSALLHISKFIDSMGAYVGNGDLCLREFSKSLDDRAYIWYTTLPPSKQAGKTCCTTYFAFATYPWIVMPTMKKASWLGKMALSVKPYVEKPKEKKSQPQVLTVSTVNNKRKKSAERSFEEPPPPVPCTFEEMIAILNRWVADGIIMLLEALKKATEEDKKNPKFCYFH
uniref:Retrotransposon gag domain-containing protein n=1 Tax=Fagus sylvatica TaxID=28930 RepID=A0A2N9H9G0_FAGSY